MDKKQKIVLKGINTENDSRDVVMADVNEQNVDTTEHTYEKGRPYINRRSSLPEKQLFAPAEYNYQEAERTGYSQYSYWKSVWQNFLKKKSAVIMLIVFMLLFVFTFISPLISKFDVNTLHYDTKLAFISPNSTYWFGTDSLGADYWCQVWYATRLSIILAICVSAGQILLGTVIGLLWGYVRSLDRIITEIYNLIDNIPTIIYMTLIALMVGKSYLIIGGALILFGWLGTARNIRNLVFMYRDREYNLASRCLGTGLWRTLYRNIFPYLISVVVLRLALAIPGTIAFETTLAYLGLISVETPSLGILLRNARSLFMQYPYMLIFPAVIVSVITITFYLAGNAFSDACDPRNHM
ncbi:MAG: ABC transporter permease [Clostridia bacterium]|jgi:oligopeptide transport system permease protein|nr:ABC transporter permease [Clostridia bacterium]